MLLSVLLEIQEWEKILSERPDVLFAIIIFIYILSVRSSKRQNRYLLILYLVVIIYMTLFNRSPLSSRRMSLNLFASYRYFLVNDYFRREILNNILLFIPLGVILAQLRSRWSTAAIPFLISIGIEILQFITKQGLLEIDDVISNGLGGILGFTAGMLWLYIDQAIRKIRSSVSEAKKS